MVAVVKDAFEAVIGLEIHVQLLTRTKMFCGCENRSGGEPNTRLCPVCLGLPGALPVPNGEAVRLALMFAEAVHGEVRPRSPFYRKQYFYPDLPKGYQITQGPVALVENGWVEVPSDPAVRGRSDPIRVRIERAHLEEDAGKSIHDLDPRGSLVDLNRAGVPLLEIVGAPDLRSAQEASDYLKSLHHLVTYLGLSDGNMEEGSLRCDANVSVRPRGTEALGTRVEIKNLNSFRFLRQALDHEIQRQISALEIGAPILAETRGWDAQAGVTRAQRDKEAAQDYRYFPEPDLPVLAIAAEEVRRAREAMPELPERRKERFREQLGLSPYEADMLVQTRSFGDFFESVAQACGDPKQAANWMLGEVSRCLNDRRVAIQELGIRAEDLAEVIRAVAQRRINLNTAREVVLPALLAGEGTPAGIIEARGLAQVSDEGEVRALVQSVLDANLDQVAQFRSGKASLRGFLVGQVMKAGRGRLDPQMVNRILDEALTRP